jgi:hypothetical protein
MPVLVCQRVCSSRHSSVNLHACVCVRGRICHARVQVINSYRPAPDRVVLFCFRFFFHVARAVESSRDSINQVPLRLTKSPITPPPNLFILSNPSVDRIKVSSAVRYDPAASSLRWHMGNLAHLFHSLAIW